MVSFRLGKESVAISGEEEWEDQQVEVERCNKFRPADADVTYYVGHLNDLFRVGLTDEDGG